MRVWWIFARRFYSIAIFRSETQLIRKFGTKIYCWGLIYYTGWSKTLLPPSTAENKQASAKLSISPNTFDLKLENQILDSETFCNCCKINFPKKRFCMEMIGISSISSYLPSCFRSLRGNKTWWNHKWALSGKLDNYPKIWHQNIFRTDLKIVPRAL